mmetsp:Transcript_7472/g.8771  ORF Transcript_7472/g.8771 Transcript_7472/m.8771 type:complete len:84 (-) Transcript_7472:222-473(-)
MGLKAYAIALPGPRLSLHQLRQASEASGTTSDCRMLEFVSGCFEHLAGACPRRALSVDFSAQRAAVLGIVGSCRAPAGFRQIT